MLKNMDASIARIKHFPLYLNQNINIEHKLYIQYEVTTFQPICGIINIILKNRSYTEQWLFQLYHVEMVLSEFNNESKR